MNKLLLPPDKSSYTTMDGTEVVQNKLDGGASRYRQDILGATATVTCRWTLDPVEFNYFNAFYRTQKALPFKIDLILDIAYLVEYTAHFIVDTKQLVEHSGLTYIVTANLEVEPVNDPIYDQTLIDLAEIYGTINPLENNTALEELLAQLEQLANDDLPDNL